MQKIDTTFGTLGEMKEPSAEDGSPQLVAIPKSEYAQLLSSLERAEAMIRRDRGKETLVVFGADGVGVFARRTNSSRVDVTDWIDKMDGYTLTHNHPQGLPFSEEDIATACAAKLAEIRITSRHYDYSMKPSPIGWDLDYWKDPVSGIFHRHLDSFVSRLRPAVMRGEYLPYMADNIALNSAWEQTAIETGLVYTRIARKQR